MGQIIWISLVLKSWMHLEALLISDPDAIIIRQPASVALKPALLQIQISCKVLLLPAQRNPLPHDTSQTLYMYLYSHALCNDSITGLNCCDHRH